MKKLPKRPTEAVSPDNFSGQVWRDDIVGDEPLARMRVRIVRFAPGARTAWHAHVLGQWLHVTEGIGRTQSRGEPVEEIRPGDTVHVGPGEWHWHGAAPDHFMTHLAMWETPAEGADHEWGSQVSDAEYLDKG